MFTAATSTPTPAPSPSRSTATGAATGVLTEAAVTSALTAHGGKVSGYAIQGAFQGVRLTVTARNEPPAFPGAPATVSTTSSTAGWLVWPLSTKPTGLVVYAHGCCGIPPDLETEAVTIGTKTGAMVLAMDFNDASAYAPDVASEDSGAGLAVVEAGLPAVTPVVAYGLSEGGSVAALMIEHHPSLVSGWVDTAGPVDLYAEAEQLYANQAPLALDVDSSFDSTLLNLLLTAVGPAEDPNRIAQLSPIDEQKLLSSLKHAVLIQATGDTLVPFESSAEMAGALAALKVPTKLEALIPAAGQEVTGFSWHVTAAEYSATYAAIKDLLAATPSFSAGLTTISTPITTAQ